MASRKVKLGRQARSLRMRSKNGLIRLRETKLKQMGVGGYRSLKVITLLIARIILVGWLRTPETVSMSYQPGGEEHTYPMVGWAVRADAEEDERLDASLVYAEVTWADLEPEEGQFAFEEFEEKNRLEAWWSEGKRLILRFVTDSPGEAGHMDIPEWLYEALGGEGLAGRFYETEAGSGFAPDYSNVILREAHRKVVLALAQRYNDHPGVAYIEIGSLGWNGEWTVQLELEGAEALPTSTISREYAWHYTSAFDHTLMLMRRPYKEAELMEVGLFNPALGDAERTWAYLDSILQGGYDEQIETDLLSMPDFYNLSPSGAHIPAEIDLSALLAEGRDDLISQMTESRLSYAVIEGGTLGLNEEEIEKLKEMQALIGYRLWVRSAEWDSGIRAGVRSKVLLRFRNDGVSPLHAGWPVELALFDGETLICRQRTQTDTSVLLPGDNEITTWIDIPAGVQPGEYQLKLAVIDPATGEPGVYLTMDECDGETLWTELGSLTVR